MNKRKQLNEIIRANGGENWWKPKLFQEKTLPLLPKELEIRAVPPKNKNFNCFLYILGLSKDDEITKDSNGFIYDTFFQKLIDDGLLVYADNPKDGDYVLYRNPKNYPDTITHSGILDKGKIISKWAWGPLIRHEMLDIPASYGDDISYIKAISSEDAKNLYWKHKEFNL